MFATLDGWLSHLEQAHVRGIDLGLDRIRPVAQTLQVDRFDCPVITVGGTNGKGSTVATLTEVYTRAGYRVATYTSPHLYVFNERVALNGVPVADQVLVASFGRVEAARRSIGVSLSYFEFTTLAALLIFREAMPEVVILEVGLGGRLDAVNLVDADVAVITSIGIDHTDWLGDTREAIAFEKAGIFRSGKVAICGDSDPPAVLHDRAVALSSVWVQKGLDFTFERQGGQWMWRGRALKLEGLPLPRLALDNVATALAAIEMAGLEVPATVLREGISTAKVPGRLEIHRLQGVEIVLDVAHNPHGAAFFMQQLPPVAGHTRAVFAMLADKDTASTLDACLGRVDRWYPAGLSAPRGQGAAGLLPLMHVRGMNTAGGFHTVAAALAAAVAESDPGDRILVFGSFYTVSAAHEWLEKNHGYSD